MRVGSHFPFLFFFYLASIQCHSCGSAHETAAAWQQHGEQHGNHQPTEQTEPDAEAGPSRSKPASSEPKHQPGRTEPEP